MLRNTQVQHGRLLALKPFRIADELVDVKESVTRYLDAQFYNLTTVGLHNWKLYGEMKNLAREIYDLDPSPSQLPMGTFFLCLSLCPSNTHTHTHTQVRSVRVLMYFKSCVILIFSWHDTITI